jgi:hypothetical protein
MWPRVGLDRTNVSDELVSSIFKVERISELASYPEDGGDMFLQNLGSNKTHTASHPLADSFYPEDGGDTFVRNIGSNTAHMAPHPRRRH